MGIPWWSSGEGSALPLQGAKVRSLIRELRSYKPCSTAKKTEQNNKKTQTTTTKQTSPCPIKIPPEPIRSLRRIPPKGLPRKNSRRYLQGHTRSYQGLPIIWSPADPSWGVSPDPQGSPPQRSSPL